MNKTAILLITADELRKDALSCYGNKIIKTPNLDQLADSGIQFNCAYCASPWCLPSRCSILTGLYPHKSGAYSNFRRCELNNGIPNLFNVLRDNGYRTAVSGKCHFAPVPYGSVKPDRTLPYEEFRDYYTSLGIDDLFLQDGKQVSVWFYDDYAKELDAAGILSDYRNAVWNSENHKVFPFPANTEWHPDAWVGRKAANYIKEYRFSNPSFLWASFSGPHYPFDPPEEYLNRVDMDALKKESRKYLQDEFDSDTRIQYKSYHGGGNIDGCGAAPKGGCKNYSEEYWTKLRHYYYANITLIDDMVGEVMREAQKKWGDDLLVIFTADHGEMLGNHGVWGKHNCSYEDVWNVPLLLKYPHEHTSQTSDSLVSLVDIFATCVHTAGITGLQTDGENLKTVMEQGGHDTIFAEGEGFLAVGDGKIKYTHIKKSEEEFYELQDLESDPQEYCNFISKAEYHPDIIKLQRKAIHHFMKDVLP